MSLLFEDALKICETQPTDDEDIRGAVQEEMDASESLEENLGQIEEDQMVVDETFDVIQEERMDIIQELSRKTAVASAKKVVALEGIRKTQAFLDSPKKTTSSLDVNKLIMNCLHGAAAMLKDIHKDGSLQSRKIHRLQLVLNSFENEDKFEGLF